MFFATSINGYSQGGQVTPHSDDRPIWIMQDGTSLVKKASFTYYLAKGRWTSEDGGALFTGDSGHNDAVMSEHTPVYNSVVYYRLPRMHNISKATTTRTRYGIFGFLWTKLHLVDPLPPACAHTEWPMNDTLFYSKGPNLLNRWTNILLYGHGTRDAITAAAATAAT